MLDNVASEKVSEKIVENLEATGVFMLICALPVVQVVLNVVVHIPTLLSALLQLFFHLVVSDLATCH
jgi:hypothetical protein